MRRPCGICIYLKYQGVRADENKEEEEEDDDENLKRTSYITERNGFIAPNLSYHERYRD